MIIIPTPIAAALAVSAVIIYATTVYFLVKISESTERTNNSVKDIASSVNLALYITAEINEAVMRLENEGLEMVEIDAKPMRNGTWREPRIDTPVTRAKARRDKALWMEHEKNERAAGDE